MKKFSAFIEGTNLIIRMDDKIEKCGFYTTRFICAENQSKAKINVLALVKKEVNDILLNDFSNPPIIFVDELTEIDSIGNNSGFAWFIDEEA